MGLIQEERAGHFHLCLFPYYYWMDESFDSSLMSIHALMTDAKEQISRKKS